MDAVVEGIVEVVGAVGGEEEHAVVVFKEAEEDWRVLGGACGCGDGA
jgi:hypothetical protein